MKKIVSIIDADGQVISVSDFFGDTKKLVRLSERRTHFCALNMIKSNSCSLKDALSAAYIQGIHDAVICTDA